jgi:hypothetical protein
VSREKDDRVRLTNSDARRGVWNCCRAICYGTNGTSVRPPPVELQALREQRVFLIRGTLRPVIFDELSLPQRRSLPIPGHDLQIEGVGLGGGEGAIVRFHFLQDIYHGRQRIHGPGVVIRPKLVREVIPRPVPARFDLGDRFGQLLIEEVAEIVFHLRRAITKGIYPISPVESE